MERFDLHLKKFFVRTPKTWRRLLMQIFSLSIATFWIIALSVDRAFEEFPSGIAKAPSSKSKGFTGLQYVFGEVKPFPSQAKSHRLAPAYPASFYHSVHPSKYPYSTDNPEARLNELLHLNIDNLTEAELLGRVLDGFTVPTYTCQKMVRMGGSYCTLRAEAEKMVCFDPNLRPEIDNCLVYSFGVGHELSFDMAIANYGCDVFAFDSDYKHMHYPRNIYPRVTFLKVRLGWRREVLILSDPSGRFPYVYRPLSDIKTLLGHAKAEIAVLKIDIENSEWNVFDKSVFQTRVLERTRQLALEVHLDYLYPDSQYDPHPGGQLEGLRQIARVLRGLHERGFRLAYYEPNYNFPVNQTLHGKTFHIYFETVWLNTRSWPAATTIATPDLDTFDSLPSVEIIHNDV